MTERFKKSYYALVKAFYEGTLAKGTCVACAVGNIVANAQGGIIKKIDSEFGFEYTCNKDNDWWSVLFTTVDGRQVRWGHTIAEKYLLKLTGYTADEMASVEFAFETNTVISHLEYHECSEQDILEDQYKGLCAVVDVLLELDEITPEDHYKQKFAEHPKLQLN